MLGPQKVNLLIKSRIATPLGEPTLIKKPVGICLSPDRKKISISLRTHNHVDMGVPIYTTRVVQETVIRNTILKKSLIMVPRMPGRSKSTIIPEVQAKPMSPRVGKDFSSEMQGSQSTR